MLRREALKAIAISPVATLTPPADTRPEEPTELAPGQIWRLLGWRDDQTDMVIMLDGQDDFCGFNIWDGHELPQSDDGKRLQWWAFCLRTEHLLAAQKTYLGNIFELIAEGPR